MSYGALKKAIIFFLSFYFLAGIVAINASDGTEEVYPFFSWFLFNRVPSSFQKDFDILIIEFEGKRLEPPVSFDEAVGMYKTLRSRIEYRYLINYLALGIKANRSEDVMRYRTEIEGYFLSHPVMYEVVEIRFDPIDRYRSGKILETNSLAIFISQGIDP